MIKHILELTIKNRRIGLWVIFLLVLVAHGNIFQNQFVMDDFDFIVDWPLIQDWKNLPQFFVGYSPPIGQEGIYSPLKTLFHAVNYHLFGLNPFGYHVISLLIHFAGIYFVNKISYVLTENTQVAFLASLFFALHPVQVEAITYMTASIDMVGMVFLLAGFYWYCNIFDDQGKFQRGAYALSLILSLLAIFTHELAISIPFLFLWYELCLGKRRDLNKDMLLRVSPFFLLTGLYALSKLFVLKSVTRGAYLFDSFTLTMLVTVKAWAKYVYLCLFPNVLTHNHMISKGISSFEPGDFNAAAVLTQSVFDAQVLVSILVLGGITYFAAKQFKRKPLITFCAGWFFIALLPVSNIIPSGVFFGERYLYPGLIGFCLPLGIFIERLCRRDGTLFGFRCATIGVVLVVGLISFYCMRTWERNKDWHNDISLFESAVRENPQSALMRTDLGIVYLESRMPDKALENFRIAVALRPDDPVIYFSMSEAYIQKNQRDEAIAALHQAISIDNTYAQAYYNLAGLYVLSNRTDLADEYLNKSMLLYRQQGMSEEADHLEKAFRRFFNPS